jgi:hypothetical protein
MTSSGYITVSKMSSIPPVSSAENGGVVFASEVRTASLVAGLQLSVISKPRGSASRSFVYQNSTTSNEQAWDIIKLEISGAPATTNGVLDVELVYNVEFTLGEANVALHQFMKSETPSAPHVVAASTKVISSMGTIVEGGVEKIGSAILTKAATAVEDIFSSGLAFLGL